MKNAIDLPCEVLTQQEKQSQKLIKKSLLVMEELSKSQYDQVVEQLKENEDLTNVYNYYLSNSCE